MLYPQIPPDFLAAAEAKVKLNFRHCFDRPKEL
jgi:hypothetical protein